VKALIDPRRGDIEDDASSTKRRSLLSLTGTLLSEISLPKLAAAWLLLIIGPCLLLGLSLLVAFTWLSKAWGNISSLYAGLWPILLLGLLFIIGSFAGRPLVRTAKRNFWALNSLIVEPLYTVFREALQQLVDQILPLKTAKMRRRRLRAATAAVAGTTICALSLLALMLVWPSTRWVGSVPDLASAHRLLPAALANSAVLLLLYLAASSLLGAFADARMPQPRDFHDFASESHPARDTGHIWRIAHLSDLHVVGERYGFRIESGRSGPCGNHRLSRALAQLNGVHATHPLDVILITGDVTDSGRSAEWAEFLDALARCPHLAERVLILPGNHDLNVVDRANPARLDLPTSPSKRLRQLRALSAMAALQGERVRTVDRTDEHLGPTLADAVRPYQARIAEFADAGSLLLSMPLAELWADVFPLVVPPQTDAGLGIILLNSNAETHFSFTNALGLISTEQTRGIEVAMTQYPQACWVIALHHHPVEYPRAAKALSERIGTTLINGSWFVRRLRPFAGRLVLMHGHRHIDWIGECAGLVIVSAPSPVMDATDDAESYFYIQTLTIGKPGRLRLLHPERVTIAGQPETTEDKS
jgi:predicted MPP superfamily phosphohydrolase